MNFIPEKVQKHPDIRLPPLLWCMLGLSRNGASKRMPISALEEKSMPETVQEYTQRLLSYAGENDPLRLPQAAPKKLAALLKGKNSKQLMRRPAPDKWSVAEIVAHLA